MAYTLHTALDLGTAGITLKAALANSDGTPHATVRDLACIEIGQGHYFLLTATIPDGFQGSLLSYTGTLGAATDWTGVVIRSQGSINPQETELSDVKTSTRMATFSLPANFSTLLINASGHVSRVTLVDTTTTNSDMRGTDNAALAATALSNLVWTNTKAGYIDVAISSVSGGGGGGSDPWLSTLNSYASGTAGHALRLTRGFIGGKRQIRDAGANRYLDIYDTDGTTVLATWLMGPINGPYTSLTPA